LVPAIFMLVTTIGALILKAIEYMKAVNIVLLIVAVILLVLAFIVLYEAVFVGIKNYRRRHHA